MVKLAIALFIFSFAIVMAALGGSLLFLRWLDEFRERVRLSRMRKVNLSWQSSTTRPNQGI